MFTIDEIRIEGEEDGFHLVIYLDDGGDALGPTPQASVRYRIGLPDQFHAEVQRTIGAWLAEGEAARDDPMMLRHADGTPYMDVRAYLDPDPKHPDYHDTMSGIYDNREGK